MGSLAAATYQAGSYAQLESAINSVNAGSGGGTIEITGNINFSGLLPSITQDVTIDGGGFDLDGNNSYRIFTVNGGSVVVQNATLVDGLVRGGKGGTGGAAIDTSDSGGGGGAGAGFDTSTGLGSNGANASQQTPGSGTNGGGSGGRGAHFVSGSVRLDSSGSSGSFGAGGGGGGGANDYYSGTNYGSGGGWRGFGGGVGGRGGDGYESGSWGGGSSDEGGGGGGGGGLGAGGAVYTSGGSVEFINVDFTSNSSIGGAGGKGGAATNGSGEDGGSGGGGGDGYGGAVFSYYTVLSITDGGSAFVGNSATGGAGGAGGAGDAANGSTGTGGKALGADIFLYGGTLNFTVSSGVSSPEIASTGTYSTINKYGAGTFRLSDTAASAGSYNRFYLNAHEGRIESTENGAFQYSYLQVYDGAEIGISSDESAYRINGAGTLDLGGNALRVTNSSGTFSGDVVGGGVLELVGGRLTFSEATPVPTTANLRLSGGRVGLAGADGTQHQLTLGTGNGEVDLRSGGFFTTGDGSVTLNAGAPLVWGADHFMTESNTLYLGNPNNGLTTLTNDLDLGATARTIYTYYTPSDGTTASETVLTGNITGSNRLSLIGYGAEISGDISGAMGITISHNGNHVSRLTGNNTYSGTTILSGGILMGAVGVSPNSNLVLNGSNAILGLADGDFNMNLGASAGELQWNNGGFAAFGGDRSVTLNGGATLDLASGDMPGYAVFGVGGISNGKLTLTNDLLLGSNLRRVVANNGTGDTDLELSGDISGGVGSNLRIEGSGNAHISGNLSGDMGLIMSSTHDSVLELSGTNTHSGTTNLALGLLKPVSTGALSANSNLILNGGVLGLASSDYAADQGSGAGQFIWNAGGFAAFGADRSVTLDSGTDLAWGSGFNPSWIRLGHDTATHAVELTNAIDLGSSTRTVYVEDGTAEIDAVLSGELTGTGGLRKYSNGRLMLTADNTLSGGIEVRGGSLAVGDGGTSGSLGTGTVNLLGGDLEFNRSDDIQVNNVILGYSKLIQKGLGELELTAANNYGITEIHSGSILASSNSALGYSAVYLYGGELSLASGVSIGNSIILAGGDYIENYSAGTDFSAFNIGSNAIGGTQAGFMGGTLSGTGNVKVAYYETSAALNDGARVGEVFALNGTGNDAFAMSLSHADVDATSFLAWFDPGSLLWVNAVDGNVASNASGGQLGFEGSFADFQSLYGTDISNYIGAWGIDLSGDSVWAVIDHNSEFSIVPEPSAFALWVALFACMAAGRRRCTR